MNEDQIAGTDGLGLRVQRPVEQVDVESRSGAVIERGALGDQKAFEVDDDPAADDRLLGPALDTQRGCAGPDLVVGHPVVEAVAGRAAVAQAVDLGGGLQVELVVQSAV